MSFIDNLADQTGTGLASGVIGGGLGAIFNMISQNQQFKQAQRLQNLQIGGQEQLMDYSMQKQLDMWNATNYQPQVEQLQKAGLNPGLLYAKGGPGGVTGSPQGGVSGQPATNNAANMTTAMGIMNQNTLLESQAKLMQAQANETNIRAQKEAGVDTAVAKSQEQLNIANTDNANANTQLQKVQTEIADLNKQLLGATLPQQIQLVGKQLDKTIQEITAIGLDNKLNQETLQTKVKMAAAQLIGQYLQNNLTKAETTQSQAQTKELGARATSELAQGHAALQNAITMIDEVWGTDDKMTIKEHWNAIQKNYTEKLINLGIGAEAIQGIGQILDHIPALNIMKGIPRGTTPPQVQGFRQNF